MKEWQTLVEARKALQELWDEADLKGRCWGPRRKGENNPYQASNITLARGSELVTICLDGSGRLVVHEFRLAGSEGQPTALGAEVRKILRKAGLPVKRRPKGN